eukprot:2030860-Amphidinium_carterae.1
MEHGPGKQPLKRSKIWKGERLGDHIFLDSTALELRSAKFINDEGEPVAIKAGTLTRQESAESSKDRDSLHIYINCQAVISGIERGPHSEVTKRSQQAHLWARFWKAKHTPRSLTVRIYPGGCGKEVKKQITGQKKPSCRIQDGREGSLPCETRCWMCMQFPKVVERRSWCGCLGCPPVDDQIG